MNKTKIVVGASFPEELLEKIRRVSPDLVVEIPTLENGRFPETYRTDAEIIYVRGATPSLEQVPNLRWLQTHWAGVDSLMNTAVWDSDALISGASGIHAPNMGQYTMAHLLGWAHRVPQWFASKQAGTWPKNRWKKFVPQELSRQTLGILGYGSIGREIARLAKPFGMRILATKRDINDLRDIGYIVAGTGDPDGRLPDKFYPSKETGAMIADCDYVVITLPLTDETRHLFDENMLREMKQTAVLINVGRGGLVKEPDLIKALQEGWIAGAGLDVFETEPLPDDSPLWKLDNVILTPHSSGFTPYYDERAVDLFVENLRRYLEKRPLLNLVNRKAGY